MPSWPAWRQLRLCCLLGLRLRRLPTGEIGAALRQHVGIAAGILQPAPVALRHQHGIHRPIEEIAVVADQDDGAGVVGQHLLQHVERLQIEIVGRLVQHQQVGRLGERAGQHQAAALAARQRAQRRARLQRREQEILHVAHDVLGLAADRHRVAPAAGQRLLQRPLGVEALAALIEGGHLQVGAELDRAGVGRQRAGQQADQRGLAAAVGADDADAVAAHHAR